MVHDSVSHALVVLMLICMAGSRIDSLRTLDTTPNLYRRIIHVYPGDVVAILDPSPPNFRTLSSHPTPLVQAKWGSRRRSQALQPSQPSYASNPTRQNDQPSYSSDYNPFQHYARVDPYTDSHRYDSRSSYDLRTRAPTSFHMRPPADQWGYDDSDSEGLGPTSWHTAFPSCGHDFQSPIDIYGNSIRYAPLPPINLHSTNGQGFTEIEIRNSGNTVVIKPKVHNIIINGGDLPGTFFFCGIHFHWSRSNRAGSEHKLDHRSYPLEMHIVSYNSRYPSMRQAMGRRDGIHVIAIFFELARRKNNGLNMCISKLGKVRNPGAEVSGGQFNVSQIMPPSNSAFYRYTGSLTTPPCTDNVIWSVYANPQVISRRQLQQFRQITLSRSGHPHYDGGNVRPVQPTGDRAVFTNDAYYYKK